MPQKKKPTLKRSLDLTVDKLIGHNLRLIRKERGITQTAFAKKLGISFQQVQKYESGTNRISASTLYVISDILHIDIADFFMGLPGQKDNLNISADEIEVLKIYSRLPNTRTKKNVRKIMQALIRE